ncbi:MAG TPA: hypothetical protein VFA46_24135 [Actinomycetes bacterium]|nr:hypothetical protein [Actinomycetes bacterium]
MDVAAALWGGILGAIAAATVYLGFLGLGLTSFDLLRFEGGLLARERTNMVYVYGMVVKVILGALLALAYRYAFEQIHSASYVGWGALLGLAQGALLLLLLPALGFVNHNVRNGDDSRPGFAGLAAGRLTPVALLATSVVFGLWVGITLVP